MRILPDYSMYVNEKYVTGYGDGYGYGDYGFGDDYGDGGCDYMNGDGGYGYVNGDGDIAFEIMPKKYPHNLIIL